MKKKKQTQESNMKDRSNRIIYLFILVIVFSITTFQVVVSSSSRRAGSGRSNIANNDDIKLKDDDFEGVDGGVPSFAVENNDEFPL